MIKKLIKQVYVLKDWVKRRFDTFLLIGILTMEILRYMNE